MADSDALQAFADAHAAVGARIASFKGQQDGHGAEDSDGGASQDSADVLAKPELDPDSIKISAQKVRKVYAAIVRNDWTWHEGKQIEVPRTSQGWTVPVSGHSMRHYSESDTEHEDEDTLRMQTKRRKLDHSTAEEMKWNVGLRTFVHRRNDWTQTIAHEEDATSESDPTTDDEIAEKSDLPAYVPVAEPLLYDAPARIMSNHPAFRTSLYNKHIIQGRALAVPIPLSQVVSALVQGWKRDGEWPPTTKEQKPVTSKSTAVPIRTGR
jgi:hypothetical protein